jgi:hypothetical protein
MALVRKRLRSRKQWAAYIRAAHTSTVKAILKLGRALSAAKKALPHGEFLKMIEHDLPFTASVAQRLMIIAADPKLQKLHSAQLLPPSWGTLYELAKLPAETFEQSVKAGTIHPQMTRGQAQMLRVEAVTRKAPTKPQTLVPYELSDGEPRLAPLPQTVPRVSSIVLEAEKIIGDLVTAVTRGDVIFDEALARRIEVMAERLLRLIPKPTVVN